VYVIIYINMYIGMDSLLAGTGAAGADSDEDVFAGRK
jgi:hypothetical protein